MIWTEDETERKIRSQISGDPILAPDNSATHGGMSDKETKDLASSTKEEPAKQKLVVLQGQSETSHCEISEETLSQACKKLDRQLKQQNEFLNHVIESLPHPFYVLDAENYKIQMANSAATGGKLTENTTCYELTHRRKTPCEGVEHACPLRTVKRTKKPVVIEHIHYNKEGDLRNMEVHGYPVFDESGNVVQMIEFSFDITERKRMEEELKNYAEKIKLFAYSISHDLKSPIIGINGLTRLLHKRYSESMDEKSRLYCDQIVKASEQVLTLIEEINAFIKTKETPLTFEYVRAKEVIETVRNEFITFFGPRGIEWSEPEDIPKVKADRMSLLRVFRNLVDNAIKYGGKELSRISIGYEESEEFHTFSVRDDGVGIKKEDAERIFDLFQRSKSPTGAEGTGLGLAIVKEIAEKHRGKVWVDSSPGVGTTFYFSISKVL